MTYYMGKCFFRLSGFIFMALMIALISGCLAPLQQGTVDAGLTESASAILHRSDYIGIVSVDGKSRFITPSNLKIEPGNHQVTVRISEDNDYRKKYNLNFIALENHTYDIFARPCSMGGEYLPGTLTGFTPYMWEASIVDRNTNQILDSDGIQDIIVTKTIPLKTDMTFKDENIEIKIEEMGFVDYVKTLLYGNICAPQIGNKIFVIKVKFLKINNIIVGGFGAKGQDLSQITDENSNPYTLKYWHTLNGYKMHREFWASTRSKLEMQEGSSILFCFDTPDNFVPNNLKMVYYYQQDLAARAINKAELEAKLTN